MRSINTLAIPASQSLKSYKPLHSSRLNTLRSKLSSVKLILLNKNIFGWKNHALNVQINKRLKYIIGGSEVFGGASVNAIADLFQLEPCCGFLYVCKDLNNTEYSVLAPKI